MSAQVIDLVVETSADGRPKAIGRDRSGRRAQRDDAVLVRADPPAGGGHHGRGDAERRATAVVDEVRAIVVASEHDHGEAAIARHRVRQTPGPDPCGSTQAMTGTPAASRSSSAAIAPLAPPVSCTSASMPSRSSVFPVQPGIDGYCHWFRNPRVRTGAPWRWNSQRM